MECTKEELYQVGCNQKKILYLILCGFALNILWWHMLGVLFWLLQLVYTIIAIVFVFQFGTSLKIGQVAMIGILILLFIPLVGLLTLLILNGKATRLLREGGIRVGLMGASRENLEKLKMKATESAPETTE